MQVENNKVVTLLSLALEQRIPIKHLLNKGKPRVGQIAHVQTEHGQRQVADIRDATAEELSHGDAHGVGGHQH